MSEPHKPTARELHDLAAAKQFHKIIVCYCVLMGTIFLLLVLLGSLQAGIL